MDPYAVAADYVKRIEQELRDLDAWQSQSLPDAAYESHQAFCLDTMTLYEWLQFVLVPRVEAIVAGRGEFPAESYVSVHAVRELGGVYEARDLIEVLIGFDEFIEKLQHGSKKRDKHHKPRTSTPLSTEPPIEASIETPSQAAQRYWHTRNAGLLNRSNHSRPGMDVQLAERVFATATGFIEFAGEPREVADGIAVPTVIEAERGLWTVMTVLCNDQDQWRMDFHLSLEHTTLMFLRQHQIHAPYTENDDARGRAMQFWGHVANRNDRWASELVVPELSELPRFGEGQVDEFFWYIRHTEGDGSAVVRVLMNTRLECRMWLTRMVRRGEAWFVDLPGTLAG